MSHLADATLPLVSLIRERNLLREVAKRIGSSREEIIVELVMLQRREEQCSAASFLEYLQRWLELGELLDERACIDLDARDHGVLAHRVKHDRHATVGRDLGP